jgi:glycosyltransferase involved in cell wall biosynthesis
MKFVLVGPAYPYRGGIAQYNSSLYRALSVQHEAHILSFSRQYPSLFFPGRTQHDQSTHPFYVQAESVLDSVNPRSWVSVARRILELGAEAMVFQWWQPFFGLAYRRIIDLVKRTQPVPAVFLCHNIFPHEERAVPGQHSLEGWLIRRTFSRADGFLVHTDGMVSSIKTMRPGIPVRRIYHPLYDFYSECVDERKTGGRSGDVPRLLFFGKIRPYKGLETLIEALALLKKEFPFQAVIAGESYMNPRRYRSRATRLGLDDQIDWQDRYIPNEDVPALFRSADLVVLPYVEATQSGVVPVAYQFGVPVVATSVGGLSEVVLEGKTGYLVPPGDPKALSAAIARYFVEGRRAEFEANIQVFRRKLTWKGVVGSLLDLVAEIGSRSGRA